MFLEAHKEDLPSALRDKDYSIDPAYMPAVRHILRVESLIAVGCKFGLNDLSMQEWDRLIALTVERRWFSEQLNPTEKREGANEGLTLAEVKKREEARKMDKIPPSGGSIFPRKKPMS